MSRQSRREQRLLKEQDTVGMRRAERKEQEELAGTKKLDAAMTKQEREVGERKSDINAHPVRIARVGKPAKR